MSEKLKLVRKSIFVKEKTFNLLKSIASAKGVKLPDAIEEAFSRYVRHESAKNWFSEKSSHTDERRE